MITKTAIEKLIKRIQEAYKVKDITPILKEKKIGHFLELTDAPVERIETLKKTDPLHYQYSDKIVGRGGKTDPKRFSNYFGADDVPIYRGVRKTSPDSSITSAAENMEEGDALFGSPHSEVARKYSAGHFAANFEGGQGLVFRDAYKN